MKLINIYTIISLFTGICLCSAPAAPRIEIKHNDQCNLFEEGVPVKFDAVLNGVGAGSGEATVELTDYFGKKKTFAIPVERKAGESAGLSLDLGTLDPGYYEMKVNLRLKEPGGNEVTANSEVPVTRIENPGDRKVKGLDTTSFGVVRFVNRTAEEARKGGYRFGIKMFHVGEPGVWWRKGLVYDADKILDASVKLGLQWSRPTLSQASSEEPGIVGTLELLSKFPINAILKVEGFPESCYDAGRYGPLAEWIAKHKGKNWRRNTVPKKEPYQQWLKEEVSKLPADQNIFEIGNEVWLYMSGEEFAQWAQMAVEAIKEARPDARIGADPGQRPVFTDKFLEGGGMNGMDILICHPYSFTPLPEHRTRPQMRNLRDHMREATGEEYDLYITEYGWPTAPKDRRGHSVSENVQAQRTVRQSLMLYAEDAKALTPHWAADREYDITDRENWFGLFRLSGQPKPVLIAHATCARMIDGSRFVGDLWYGPGIGAMLFERDGKHTLALWTAEEEKEVEVDAGVPEVAVVDIVGRETVEKTTGGKIRRKLDGNVVYIAGVSEALAGQAVPPSEDLNPDRWTTRENPFSMRKAEAMQIDGTLAEWASDKPVTLGAGSGANVQAQGMLKWDSKFLYVAMKVTDRNVRKQDSFTVSIGTKPSQQPSASGIYDYTFSLNPGLSGAAALTVENRPRYEEPLEIKKDGDPSGIQWEARPVGDGWTAELAIPISFLKGFPEPKAGSRIACRLAFEKGKSVLANAEKLPSRLWPYVTFED